ncbi:MAG: hypothetical protein A2X49_05925 [Lentisphaerae bacterium GWF2_52_8]|nr:MAG: hypothetical protein A2X49_05925 [Lentisphaerae bacterium GWF2_52_8]
MNQNKTRNPEHPLLLVDDATLALETYEGQLRGVGFDHLLSVKNGGDAIAKARSIPLSAMILDLNMPGITGEEVLSFMTLNLPHVPVLIVTASESTDCIVRCMKAGAFDYLVKPVSTTRLLTAINRALEVSSLKNQAERLRTSILEEGLHNPSAFQDILSKSPEMTSIFKYIEAIAPTSNPVLITGETGTGKEMMAKSIHTASGRKGRFVAVNVAGLDDNMFSDTLFGHGRGSFTGAYEKRQGLVESAAGGTLFLDEIGELAISSQVKLLRLLQEHEYYPIGEDKPLHSDARLVLATNRAVTELQNSKDFRKDLFYRICHHHLHLPPLRDRKGDLPLLLHKFLQEARESAGRPLFNIPASFDAALDSYSFPGNIRELRGLVFDAASVSDNSEDFVKHCCSKLQVLLPSINPSHEKSQVSPCLSMPVSFSAWEKLPTLDESEWLLIVEALRRCGGNRSAAATLLGTTRQLLYRKLKAHNPETSAEELRHA